MPASLEAAKEFILLTFEPEHTHFPITTLWLRCGACRRPCSTHLLFHGKAPLVSEPQSKLANHLSTEQQDLLNSHLYMGILQTFSQIAKWTCYFKDSKRHYLPLMTEIKLVALKLKSEVQKMCPTYKNSAAS